MTVILIRAFHRRRKSSRGLFSAPRHQLRFLLMSSLPAHFWVAFSSLLFSSLGQKAFPCLQFLVRPSIRPGRFLFAAAGFLVFLLAPEILRGCCKSLRYGGSQGGGVDILPFLSGLNAECRWTFRRVEEGILPKVDILTNGELLHRTLLLFFLSFFLSSPCGGMRWMRGIAPCRFNPAPRGPCGSYLPRRLFPHLLAACRVWVILPAGRIGYTFRRGGTA